jgi:hypothetical protein
MFLLKRSRVPAVREHDHCKETDMGCFLQEMLKSAETPGVESTSRETPRTEWR